MSKAFLSFDIQSKFRTQNSKVLGLCFDTKYISIENQDLKQTFGSLAQPIFYKVRKFWLWKKSYYTYNRGCLVLKRAIENQGYAV